MWFSIYHTDRRHARERSYPLLGSDWRREPVELNAVYAAGRGAKPAARLFTDFLVEALRPVSVHDHRDRRFCRTLSVDWALADERSRFAAIACVRHVPRKYTDTI
jgi:hypothetical protein